MEIRQITRLKGWVSVWKSYQICPLSGFMVALLSPCPIAFSCIGRKYNGGVYLMESLALIVNKREYFC